MIRVEFIYKAGLIKGFCLSDHAEYDEYGMDIVCSAVTSNSIAVINSLEELVKVEFEKVEANEGIIECLVEDSFLETSQLLFKHLKLALEVIASDYPDNIKIMRAGGDSKC